MASTEHDGDTVWFCSSDCKEEFEADPRPTPANLTRTVLKVALAKGRRRRIATNPAITPAASTSPPSSTNGSLNSTGPTTSSSPHPKAAGPEGRTTGATPGTPPGPRHRLCPAPTAANAGTGTFHSLRNVFATWALIQPGLRLEHVSRLLGRPPPQDIYIHVDFRYQGSATPPASHHHESRDRRHGLGLGARTLNADSRPPRASTPPKPATTPPRLG